MEKFDVVIIGAATSGAYFARKMAEQGYSVKVIEKLSREKLGKRLDIFHVFKRDFDEFGIPTVTPEDKEWAFEFKDGYTASPYNNYPKHVVDPIVGMHMPEYIAKMNRWAEEAGVQFEYSAEFSNFIYDNDKIVGFKYFSKGKEKELYARCVVDCSGTASAARRKLPANYGVENFELTPEDVFFVVLRYVKFKNTDNPMMKDGMPVNIGYPYYKSWIAPCGEADTAILGIGACHSYDYAEKVYKEFEKNVPMPEYEIVRFERGTTPYTRPPYSFVGDGFIVSGDAGCLTKPNNGEGVTSAMVQMNIAADVLGKALKEDGYVTKQKLWQINVEYNKVQGADFASTRAILTKAINATKDEFEYFFKHNIIFSEKFLSSATNGPEIKITLKDYLQIGWGVLAGIVSRKISIKSIKLLMEGLTLGDKLKKLYLAFPTSPEGYFDWTKQADELWKKVGKMQ